MYQSHQKPSNTWRHLQLNILKKLKPKQKVRVNPQKTKLNREEKSRLIVSFNLAFIETEDSKILVFLSELVCFSLLDFQNNLGNNYRYL